MITFYFQNCFEYYLISGTDNQLNNTGSSQISQLLIFIFSDHYSFQRFFLQVSFISKLEKGY